jgi:hypothetical protein
MSDQLHAQEGQVQRAKRLREQIEGLRLGRPMEPPNHGESLREQIADRTNQLRVKKTGERDGSMLP